MFKWVLEKLVWKLFYFILFFLGNLEFLKFVILLLNSEFLIVLIKFRVKLLFVVDVEKCIKFCKDFIKKNFFKKLFNMKLFICFMKSDF